MIIVENWVGAPFDLVYIQLSGTGWLGHENPAHNWKTVFRRGDRAPSPDSNASAYIARPVVGWQQAAGAET